MGYEGFFEILMITLISSKKLGGYEIMSHTVAWPLNIFIVQAAADWVIKMTSGHDTTLACQGRNQMIPTFKSILIRRKI